MIRRLNENKENQIYVARLDDGEVFYEGKLNSTFKTILGRTIDMYYTVENVVISYLRGLGYGSGYMDDWSSDELANVFVDEFIEDEAKDFNRYKDFTLMRDTVSESYRTNISGLKESSNSVLDNIRMYIDNINMRWPCKDGDLDIWDNGDGTYKIVIMDNRGRVVRDVIESQRPNYLVIDVKALYDILKIWND